MRLRFDFWNIDQAEEEEGISIAHQIEQQKLDNTFANRRIRLIKS